MPHVEALVLAAGLSTRMGDKNKLLLQLAGRSLVEHVVSNFLASGIQGLTVVLGNQAESIKRVLEAYDVKIVYNPGYAQGMGSSISRGVESVLDSADAVMIMPGDMPFVSPATVNLIHQTYINSNCLITYPVYNGKRGHPVLFDKKLFPELLKLSGDTGGRKILNKYSGSTCRVEVKTSEVLMDIDSWEDYVDLARREKRKGI